MKMSPPMYVAELSPSSPAGVDTIPVYFLRHPRLPPSVYNALKDYDQCIDNVDRNYDLDWGGDCYW